MDLVIFLTCALAASITGNIINVVQISSLREELQRKNEFLRRATHVIYERLGMRHIND